MLLIKKIVDGREVSDYDAQKQVLWFPVHNFRDCCLYVIPVDCFFFMLDKLMVR